MGEMLKMDGPVQIAVTALAREHIEKMLNDISNELLKMRQSLEAQLKREREDREAQFKREREEAKVRLELELKSSTTLRTLVKNLETKVFERVPPKTADTGSNVSWTFKTAIFEYKAYKK